MMDYVLVYWLIIRLVLDSFFSCFIMNVIVIVNTALMKYFEFFYTFCLVGTYLVVCLTTFRYKFGDIVILRAFCQELY